MIISGPENVILKPRHHQLTGSELVPLAQSKPHCRIDAKIIGFIAIFISCCYLINSLSNHLLECMLPVGGRSIFHQVAALAFDDAESQVNFPHQKEPRIRVNLCTSKINENRFVEIRSYRLFLCFIIPEIASTSDIINISLNFN